MGEHGARQARRDSPAGILLVDGQPARRAALRAVLRELPHDLAEASSPQEALALLKAADFAAILIGVRGPDRSGFEIAQRIRAEGRLKHIPITFIATGKKDAESAAASYAVGAADYLVEPIEPALLRAKIARLIETFSEARNARLEADELRRLIQGVKEYAIFMLDPEGRVATWNAGAERIKGYSAGEILGKHVSCFYPEEEVKAGKVARVLDAAVAQGMYQEEGWRVRKDGSRFWASVVITALLDEDGKVRGFSKITRDMTERKRAEENARLLLQEETARRAAEASALEAQLAQREERHRREMLQVTLVSIGDGVIVTDVGGVVTFLNPVAQALIGWTPAEALGKSLDQIFRIFDEETRLPVESPVAKLLRDGLTAGIVNHVVLIARDGTEIPIDESGAPIRDEDGSVWGMVLVFRDVRETRKALEARLHLAAVVESSDDAITSYDLEGRIVSWNKGAERLYGYTAEEAVGVRSTIVVPPERADEWSEIMQRVKRGERLDHFETVRVRKDGGQIDVSLTISPIKTPEGRIFGVSKVARDVTAGKRDMEALRESEARKAAILDMALDAIITIDFRGRIVEFNPTAEQMFGYSHAEVVGREMGELIIPPSLRDQHRRGLARYLATGEGPVLNKRIEMRALRADGTEFPIELAIARISAQGPPFFTGSIRDITDRHRNEKSLRFLAEAGDSLAVLVDYSSTLQKVARLAVPFFADWCVVDMVQPDGTLQHLAIAHADPSKVKLVEDLQQRYPPDPNARRGAVNVLRTGKSEMMAEIPESLLAASVRDQEHLRILRSLGLKSYLCVPVRVRGEIIGVVTFVTAESGRRYGPADLSLAEDLAYRAGIAIENARLYSELKDADRRKDDFLAMLAHELRNPLAPLRNALHLIRLRGADSKMLKKLRGMMERQVEHMSRLVDDLLDVSRITRGKIALVLERLDLRDLVAQTVEDHKEAFEAAGVAISVETPDAPVEITGDKTRLIQVLDNLLTNAAKFTNPGGAVILKLAGAGGSPATGAVLSVGDTGIGIDPELLPHIFDTFAQADRSLDRSKGGLGLGLALVKGLVELHGGTVEAASAGVGRGAKFTVRLPHGEELPALSGARPAARPKPVHKSLRILVVEDNRDAAESLCMLLEEFGYQVAVAYSGPEGIRAAMETPPQIVICDLGLPGMDGYSVAKALRREPSTAKARLIAITGYGRKEDRSKALEAGFDDHIVKPADPEKLLQKLEAPI